jgi:hypothetical protein
MSIEAMKQALEALDAGDWYIGQKNPFVCPSDDDGEHENQVKAFITALRAAIEQAEKQEGWTLREVLFENGEPIAHRDAPYDQTSLELCKECGWKAVIPGDGCLVCARQKAKPVAWMYDFLSDDRDEVIRDWVTQSQDDIKRENGFNVRPLYTAPRQWVELTDDEARALVNRATFGDRTNWQALVYMVDAKLKEKNAA